MSAHKTYLDFEKPIAELEAKIEELEALSEGSGAEVGDDIKNLRKRVQDARAKAYAGLTPWQKAQVARHPERPHVVDYIRVLIDDFVELRGDRGFSDDQAIVGGLGQFRGQGVVIMGHEKGTDTSSRLKHNFGMARPEGYRKAIRLMDMAERFSLPVISFVDTPGAYPGLGAEERGQAEAIARSTERCLTLGVPMISIITGEGGSGGAIAIAAANSVLMLEHSVYSVISPEGCASILWRDSARAADAAEAMRITAQDLHKLGVIDGIIPEPAGGAHSAPNDVMDVAGEILAKTLGDLSALDAEGLKAQRRDKFLKIGRVLDI